MNKKEVSKLFKAAAARIAEDKDRYACHAIRYVTGGRVFSNNNKSLNLLGIFKEMFDGKTRHLSAPWWDVWNPIGRNARIFALLLAAEFVLDKDFNLKK